MAFGRNQRLDSKRSSSCCSTVTIVVFVALCLVGVWMLTSSTVVPVEMTLSTKPEVKEHVLKADSKPDGDGSQDVPEDAAWGSTIDNAEKTSKAETSEDQKLSERSTENSVDSSQRNKNASVTSKSQTYNDESGTGEGSEVANSAEDTSTEDGDHNSEDQNDRKITNVEQTTVEAAEEQEAIKEQNLDQETNNGQSNSLEETSTEFGGKELQQTDVDTNSIEHQEKRSDNETNSDETIVDEQQPVKSENNSKETKHDDQQKSNESRSLGKEGISDGESVQEGSDRDQIEENVEQDGTYKNSDASNIDSQTRNQDLNDPDGTQSDLLHEKNMTNGVWTTQAAESRKEKEVLSSSFPEGQYSWKICNVTSGADYIPCLDNEVALKMLPSTKHYQHRERHCPEENPTCLVPLPNGYQRSIEWPASREKIWYHNVPHTQLAVVKGHQNWVKVSGEYLIFPGGGTQFKNGALHYIDFIEESMPDIAWGKRSRVVLDVGCGVASFGGFLFDRDVLTMSFAPKDEHEAQVQFALERGIPAISAVMGTKRLPFPSTVFDVIHCARCRVPWHIEGGVLLLELNRLLRPGGYFVWSATPVYQKLQEDQDIWSAMSALTKNMCWEMVAKRKDRLNRAGMAIYRKPSDNACYERRKQNLPPLCQDSDDPNAAWNISLQACMHKLSVGLSVRGSQWPEKWPQRLEKTPYWLNSSQMGVYGKPAPEDFQADYRHWKHVVSNSYMSGMGINWTTVRNVMDMRSVYGGFAAALQDTKVWVINVVSVDSPDTLPIIYERGLFGIYHDWCESFSTYPRTYDLLHADHLFSRIKKRCKLVPVFVEVDRILRPQGNLIVRDTKEVIDELEGIARSLKWEIKFTHSKDGEGLLCVQKTMWRPKEVDGSASSSSSP